MAWVPEAAEQVGHRSPEVAHAPAGGVVVFHDSQQVELARRPDDICLAATEVHRADAEDELGSGVEIARMCVRFLNAETTHMSLA